MIPMLEMAGEHSHFISKLLYIVNITSSQEHRHNHRTDGTDKRMGEMNLYIRQQKPYERISSPF